MSKNAESSIDKRARRTRGLLAQALMDLGAAQSIDTIEVGELADAAGIGRSTFYAHYANKQDFITQSFVNMIGIMERKAEAERPDRADLLPAKELFDHFSEGRAFVAQFIQSGDMVRVMTAGELKLREVVDANLQHRAPDWTRERRQDAAVYVAAGFMGLARWWMEGGMKRTPEQMCAAFARLSDNALLED